MKFKQEIRNILFLLITILILIVFFHRFFKYETDAVLLIVSIIIIYFTMKKLSNYIDQNEHLTASFKIIRDLNQLIVREKEPKKLLQKSCDILTSGSVYRNAWIITLDKHQNIEHCIGTYSLDDFKNFKEKVSSQWIPHCIQNTNQSREDYSSILNISQTCNECSLQQCYKQESALNIALKYNKKLYGYLNLSIDKKYLQNSKEVNLLKEVAGDIAYALYNIKREQTASELKNLYDNIINSVDNIIFVKDKSFTYIACNSAFEKLISKTKEMIIGKTDYELFSKEVADAYREHDIQVAQSHQAQSNNEWVVHADGRPLYLLTTKSPLVNSAAEVVGLVGNSVDLSEQNRIQELFHQAQAFAKIGNWEHDLITDEITASAETLHILGLNPKMKIYKSSFIQLCHPEDREEYTHAIENSRNKKSMSIYVNRIIKHDTKEIRYVEHRWITKYEDKRAIKTVGTTQDVTTRVKQEKALQISNDKFKKAFNQTPNIIMITTLKTGKIYDVNQTFEKILGFKKEKVVGKTTYEIDLWHNIQDRDKYVKTFQKYGFIDGDTYKFNTKNKTFIIANLYASLINIENEEYILAVAEDITQEQKILKQLEQSKQELETIIQEAPNPIMVHNEDGKVLFINKIWLQLTGYSKDEIDTLGKWTKNACLEKTPLVQEYINGIYALNHNVDKKEFKILTKSGKTLIWQLSSAPLGLMDEKQTVISSAMDITELKRKDELIITQSRHAAMGEMIGMIAHQWRQPISVIAMGANNILADIALEEFSIKEAENASKNILIQTQHLSQTIDDFRNFFKSDKELLEVNIKEILNQTYSIVKDSLNNNNILLENIYNSETRIKVYPRELMQVFVNIINNAKDALVSKKIQNAFIKIKVYNEKEYVITEICDNAGGIDTNLLTKIFDPYFTTKDEKNGTGLGLYMSKTIIEDHLHGRLEVSNSKQGACFKVLLPKETSI